MIKRRIKSFGWAITGFVTAFREEINLRIHVLMMTLVLITSWFFGISQVEWILVVLSIGMVISAELLNTAVENLSDHVTKDPHPLIKKAKDVAAAAVLIAAITAAIIGLIIFLPHLLRLVQSLR